jgi:hypothetical protein
MDTPTGNDRLINANRTVTSVAGRSQQLASRHWPGRPLSGLFARLRELLIGIGA